MAQARGALTPRGLLTAGGLTAPWRSNRACEDVDTHRKCPHGTSSWLALLACMLGPAPTAPPAAAADVSHSGFAASYEASPGEVNNITVTLSSSGDQYIITDVVTIADVDNSSNPNGC